MSLLRLQGAAFGYGSRTIVSGVDLAVGAGDFLGIVGPNGAGKTTLFRGLLGLLRPLAGSVERNARAIGYVPQRERLDPLYPLCVDEVVHMGAYGRLAGIRGVPREARAHARELLERVGLPEHGSQAFSALSGGQRQRVLLARALMTRPDVLLLDEPTSGVDRAAARAILDLLQTLKREQRLAILVVTHQTALVRDVLDRVLWVSDGRVVEGSPAEMLVPEHLDELFASASDGSPGDD